MHGGPGPVIYGTTTRTGQGPYPALPDNECKNSDHLAGQEFPLSASGQTNQVFAAHSSATRLPNCSYCRL